MLNTPYHLNRASVEDRHRLGATCDHFQVTSGRKLLCEVILRLGHQLKNSNVVNLPVDEQGKRLFKMYKYFDSLAFTNN